ncbi:glycosyltransferase family 2 protein [Nitrosomonas sp. Nm33]|uniref:glycosyltransferase family 2 protein n=1 Tax=Nitrosomonas sp. Nm33 TaxID=133724 RepID=UPI00089C26AA|nr:glycosyltransferase family 2 protein [Nitrosomonas sp. Nm33]SDY21266.1 Glycosyltransferase, GT2 family [Nitrosomonas sp. Nm33]
MAMTAKLTAVVCTFDRYDLTRDCVDALLEARATMKESRDFEILVVDNTPPERRKKKKWLPAGVQMVTCDTAGLSHARNCGISNSTGRLIAFIDDDALPAKDWPLRVIEFFDTHEDALAVGGYIEPLFDGCERPEWLDVQLTAYLSCLDYGPDCRPLRAGEYIVGANMAFRREVFEENGVFDVKLGRQGNAGLLSNEEIHLFKKIERSTYYDPSIKVLHRIPPGRTQQAWFRRRVVWQAVSDHLSGIVEPAKTVQASWKQCVMAAPAETRTLRLLHEPCATAEEFHQQLSAIYFHTQWGLMGFAD